VHVTAPRGFVGPAAYPPRMTSALSATSADASTTGARGQGAGAEVSLIVLGGGGDLTRRLLLPGLASLLTRSEREVEIMGATVRTAFDDVEGGAEAADRFVDTARWFTGDVTDEAVLAHILAACQGTPVLFFALPPSVTAKVCDALRGMELPTDLRLALEKPFGVDQASAEGLDQLIAQIVPERQVFRIDHFLGKSTVLNILGLRFSNTLLKDVWSKDRIERVEIVYDEALGLEGRAGYYDNAGALVDMIQSHLLQVLALLTMEPLPRLDEVELRSNAAQVLRNTRVSGDDPVAASRRARYTAGRIGDRDLPSYVDSPGVDPARMTETLAEVELEVRTPRWSGVPFLLRSGKALGTARKEVSIVLTCTDPIEGLAGALTGDRIVLDLKSDRVRFELTMNGSGDPFELERTEMTAEKEPGDLLPYGQVLEGILDGDPLLSVRGDIAEECWRIVDPVIEAWRRDEVPMQEYAAGSGGPDDWK
jgi:glucose-6-phosphate 1-dehydrogenase